MESKNKMKRLFLTFHIMLVVYFSWAQNSPTPAIPAGFDSFVARVAAEWKIPGMVVVVVKDG